MPNHERFPNQQPSSVVGRPSSTIMKLLFLTPQLPHPPHQGTTLRNFNLVRQLAPRHTIDLLTFHDPTQPLELGPLRELCRRVESVAPPPRPTLARLRDTLATPLPDMALRLESAAMHALISRRLREERYDVVQIEGIEVAQYGRHVADVQPRPALIFDDHNCEYLLQKRNALTDLRQPQRWPAAGYSLVQWQKLRRYEAHICRSANATLAVSPADADALHSLAPQLDITVIPNGIDLDLYQPAHPQSLSLSPSLSPPTLVFTGKMDYRPNVDAVLWFAQSVLPLVQQEVPNVRFQIVGLAPHARLKVLRGDPAIEITGAVDDVRPYIERAAAYVIPLRVGGGTRFKALEAMACGQAVVSTSLGVEGIGVQNGRELLLADEPRAFAEAVLRLLRARAAGDPLIGKLAANARAFVEQRYGWSQIVPKVEEVYERVG